MIQTVFTSITSMFRSFKLAEEKPLTFLFFAGGVILTFAQYRAYLHDQKVEFSYQHVQEWEDKGYKAAYEDMISLVRTSEELALKQMPEELAEEMSVLELRQAQVNSAMQALADEPEIRPQLHQLVYFFDKMSVCVERDLCDPELLREFFRDQVLSFTGYARTYVAIERDSFQSYASLTEAYATQLRTENEGLIWKYWPF